MDSPLQDIRYGLRTLVKSPGFTAVAILTLALGIGANTAIFSLINGILLGALPVRDAKDLVLLQWTAYKDPRISNMSSYGDCEDKMEGANASGCTFSKPFVDDVQAQANVFSGVAVFASTGELDLSGNGPPSRIDGEYVNGDFFTVLGVHATAGRTILPSDDAPGAPPVAMLSYRYWQSAFGGSPSAIGKVIHLNGVAFTIVGVIEPKFFGISPGNSHSFWVPFSVQPQITVGFSPEQVGAGSWWIVILGRLKSRVPAAKAQAAMDLLFHNETLRGNKLAFQPGDHPVIKLVPAQQGLTGSRRFYSEQLYILMLAVGIILLIACANVAGLTLARSAARRREIAVRRALGASRARVARQLLTESLLLSLAGGTLGTLLVFWSMHGIAAVLTGTRSGHLPFAISLDARVFVFTAAAAILTGILFGLAPALRSTRMDLTPALKEGAAAKIAGRHGRWFALGNSLVVVQVALAVVVLAGAGLMVRTLHNLRDFNPGFDTRNILLFNIDAELAGYKAANVDSLYSDLTDRLRAIPGVMGVSYSRTSLLSGNTWGVGFRLHGLPNERELEMDTLAVGPNFFKTMRMHLLAGRSFQPADFQIAAEAPARERARRMAPQKPSTPAFNSTQPAPPIPAIVNETFVREFFPKEYPVGHRFGKGEGPSGEGWVIVGMVNDAKYSNLRRAIGPTAYVPSSGGGVTFELRTARAPTAFVGAVRETVNKLDSNLPITDVTTQREEIDDMLLRERTIANASSFFAILALALACIGLYGLLAYEVARRTREIGIRMTLGARQQDVLRLVVGQGIALALVGVIAGVGAALGVSRFLSSLLFGVKPEDPTTYAAVALLLALVALAACYVPARRAARVDPMQALRSE